jgi:hypothetical protein
LNIFNPHINIDPIISYSLMDLHLDLNDEFWYVVLTFHNSLIEHIIFGEPQLFDIEALRSMVENSTCKRGLWGGGNSSWSLDKIDDEFFIEYEISGCGEGSSIKVKLPKNEMYNHLYNILKLLAFENIHELHQFALTMDGVKIIVPS